MTTIYDILRRPLVTEKSNYQVSKLHQYVFEAEGKLLHVFYGIYEDQGGSGALVNRRLTSASRIRAALSGSRNYGQRFLEVAVHGYERPEDARVALVRELGKVIKVGK